MSSCYLYIRVSTEEQAKEGFSIDNQKRACVDYAKMHDYQIKRVFVDDGKSARTMDRPAFQELLQAVKEIPADAVIIYKIDRFARNVGDFANIRKQFKERSIKLLSVTENGDVTEGLVGNIFASVAEWESEVNGQRTRAHSCKSFARDGNLHPRLLVIGVSAETGKEKRASQTPMWPRSSGSYLNYMPPVATRSLNCRSGWLEKILFQKTGRHLATVSSIPYSLTRFTTASSGGTANRK